MKNLKTRHLTASCRTGSLLVEMVVCTVLLSVVAALLVPGIHAVHEQRKATRFDTLCLIEMNNQCATMKTTGKLQPELSQWFLERYPTATTALEPVAAPGAGNETLNPFRLTITRPASAASPAIARSIVFWSDIEGAQP